MLYGSSAKSQSSADDYARTVVLPEEARVEGQNIYARVAKTNLAIITRCHSDDQQGGGASTTVEVLADELVAVNY
ncbi:hypothetical protein LZ31DRAFT_561258 [Colletotrichum somersetense]|nr:hypothetical protein LZ31DRAFT_561258 [Colletotrichum somersetense]